MGIGLLSVDVLLPILEILQGGQQDLYRCSLVNRAFNAVASKILYSRVVIAPPSRSSLDLRDDGLSVRISIMRRVWVSCAEACCLAEFGATHICMPASLCSPCTVSGGRW